MSDRVRVWCLRHAESENVVGQVAGAVPTASLTDIGRRQAHAVAQALAGEPISTVYSSTARRAWQTARPLADALGIDVQTLPELVEVDIGRYEGSNNPAVRTQTAAALRAWIVDNDLARRVADGETGHEVVARMTAAFHRITDQHPGQTVAVVGHVASLTVSLSRLCLLGDAVWGTPLPHAEPLLVERDGQHWHCPAWPGASRQLPGDAG